MKISVSQTRHYGKVEHTFQVEMNNENDEPNADEKELYQCCLSILNAMFVDFEANELAKISWSQDAASKRSASKETMKFVEIFKEVKDGKEYYRARSEPGTYFGKFGVAIYPDMPRFEDVIKRLGTGYSAKVTGSMEVQTEGSKKVLDMKFDIPF